MKNAETPRSRVVGKLIAGALTGIATAARFHPRARPEKHNTHVIRDVAYRTTGDHAHKLDVYVPTRGEGPFPCVLYIHGGAFRILSKETHFAMALAFARRGMVVFNVNYRLAPKNKFPAALEDLSFAYEWLAKNGASYGADLSKLFLAGESAGGNLATALGIATVCERPEPFAKRVFDQGIVPIGVMPACGILEVSRPERFAAKVAKKPWVYDRILATSTGYLNPSLRDEGASDLADPLVMLEKDIPFARPLPPFFAGCGTRDPLIDDTRRLGKALEKRGVRCDVEFYPGEVHAFHAFVWRSEAQRFWRDTYRFIDSCLAAKK